MATPAKERTTCYSCGESTEVVGPLVTGEDWPGRCQVCAADLRHFDALVAEVRRHLEPWVAACAARVVPRKQARGALELACGLIDEQLERELPDLEEEKAA